MDRDQAKQEIRSSWRSIIPHMTNPAKQKVNGETSWICPICGHGKNGDGLTLNPDSKDKNGLKCFGCGFAGDIIDLWQKVYSADYNTALYQLADQIRITIDQREQAPAAANSGRDIIPIWPKSTGGSFVAPQGIDNGTSGEVEPQAGPADYVIYYLECQRRLEDPAAMEYLRGRGISCETAKRHGLGFDPAADPAQSGHPCPRIIIPTSPEHYIGRSIDPNTPKQFAKLNPKGGSPAIFNGQALYSEAQEVFIVEGAFDALSICEAGAAAIALNSTANSNALIKQLEQKNTSAIVILCLDNDDAGSRATDILQQGLQRLNIPFVTADICGGHKDPNEYLQADRTAFFEAVRQAKTNAKAEIAEKLKRARQAEIERQERTGTGMVDSFLEAVKTRRYEPIPTGITDIDKALGGGFMRQWLVLLGAPPGAGKTALAQWIFEDMAKRGTTCLYLNLEMSRDQMLARSLSRIAAHDGEKIKPVEILQGFKWDWTQEAIVAGAAEKYKRDIAPHMIYNPDEVTPNLDSIMEYCEAAADRAQAVGLPVPIVVIDYLQVITGGPREDKIDLIQRAIGRLKGYAIKYNTVVFAIMAQNREANRTGISGMESGRDTSNIEYGADLLLGLDYTKCLKRAGGKSKDELTREDMNYKTLKINKGRFSEAGTQVDLIFDGSSMTYHQVATYIEEPIPRKPVTRL